MPLSIHDETSSPALAHQRAEESLCECGAAGSGEGHADWCPWEPSEWKKWGEVFDAAHEPKPPRVPGLFERAWRFLFGGEA